MKYTIVSNSCVGGELMQKLNLVPYTNPFVYSMFMNDEEYLHLCTRYDEYIRSEPVFLPGPNPETRWSKQTGITTSNYPITNIGGAEIHWIHDTANEHVLEKYNRRVQRYLSDTITPIFTWCETEFFNKWTDVEYTSIVDTFLTLEHSYFLGSKRYTKMHPRFLRVLDELDDDSRGSTGVLHQNNQAFSISVLYEWLSTKYDF